MPRLQRYSVTAVLALSIALGACGGEKAGESAGGGNAETEATPATKTLTADGFVTAMEEVSGFDFEGRDSSSWTLVGTATGEDAYGTYGAFSIYVLTAIDDSLKILLSTDDGKEIAPEDDIYWEQNDRGAWSATKRVGENVVVVWQAGEDKTTKDTFDRLTADVQQAVDAAS